MAGSNTEHRSSMSECDDNDDDNLLVDDEVCSELELIDEPHPGVESSEPKSSGDKKRTQIEYIKQRQKRTSAFRKRKTGLMKKGFELGKLTGAEVLVVVVRDDMMFTYGTSKLRSLPQMGPGRELLWQCIQSSESTGTPLSSSRLDEKGDTSDTDPWEPCQEQKQTTTMQYCSAISEGIHEGPEGSSMSHSPNDLRRTVSEPASAGCTRHADGDARNPQQTLQAPLFSGSEPYLSRDELQPATAMAVPPMQPSSNMLSASLLDGRLPVDQYSTVDNQPAITMGLQPRSLVPYPVVPGAGNNMPQLPNGPMLAATGAGVMHGDQFVTMPTGWCETLMYTHAPNMDALINQGAQFGGDREFSGPPVHEDVYKLMPVTA